MHKWLLLLYVCTHVLLCYASENHDFSVDIFSEKHIKKSQNEYEDRFCHGIVEDGKLYAIFDGHGGYEVADFVAHNFINYFQKTSGSIQQRMEDTFKNIDQDEYIKNNNHCGSTGSVVFIKDKILHCAHIGDSRILLEEKGMLDFVTIDHLPNRIDERIRIKDGNGLILNKRVNNLLSVSRSFGHYGISKRLIITEPEYKELSLVPKNRFLVLATKGLWKVVSNEEVVVKLKEQASIRDMNLAKDLVLLARQKGSRDDVTVMVVDLNPNLHSILIGDPV